MASTYRAQTLMARNSVVSILDVTSSGSTIAAVGTVLTANAGQWRLALIGSSYSTLTTTNDVNVKLDVDDKIGFFVSWAATQEATPTGRTMTVTAGSGRGAWRRSLGAFTHTLHATGSSHTTRTMIRKWIMGPFEGSRFAQYATSTASGVKMGQQYIEFKMTSNSSGDVAGAGRAGILPFRWPDVQYDT